MKKQICYIMNEYYCFFFVQGQYLLKKLTKRKKEKRKKHLMKLKYIYTYTYIIKSNNE